MRATLIFLLYWTLQGLAFPFFLLYLGIRVAKNRAYAERISERFGFLPHSFHRTVPGAIWLHAVSVGEALTAVALLKKLKERMPDVPVYVSCTTLAGRAMAEQKLAGLAAGVFYAPIDYRFAVRRVLRTLKPALVIVMETEIWPNLYRDARRSGARLMVVNGRISDKALPSYRRWAWFFREVLTLPDVVLAQDSTASARYRELGAARVIDAGNLKYDFSPEATVVAKPVKDLLARVSPTHVWIAASTMPPAEEGDPDEDDIVLDAFDRLSARLPGMLLILVPRRTERFDEAARKLQGRGVPFVRRSQLTSDSNLTLPGVLLVDTIGELSGLFRTAHAVFMGGTFPHRGGHNILEPAAFGVPVVTGSHMENFTEIAEDFRTHGAVVTVDRPEALAGAVERLLTDEDERARIGLRGRELSDRRRGATARAMERINTLYDAALVRPLRWNPLSYIWMAGMAVDRAWKNIGLDLPGQPVISVGNLSMGGTGKTPFVLWLCERLSAQGLKPAVLMRGYKRKSAERVTTCLPGSRASVERTGEEAQLILRQGIAALGIGANRQDARFALERIYRADVYVLDDGFQHWRTRRDLDIVLIDAIDPYRGGVFPGGRLREPFSALRRADAIVITRAEEGRVYQGLVDEIRRWNATAPMFYAQTAATLPAFPKGASVGAFCGVGQPEGFRRTLKALGVEAVFFEVFADHHHYTAGELKALANRADVLLTTEKDLLNIDPQAAADCRILAVPARMEIRGEEELLRAIDRCLRSRAGRA